MKAQIYNVKLFNGSYQITFLTNEDCRHYVEELGGKELDLEFNEHRDAKRIGQLQLGWKLAEAIGHKRRLSKDEVMEDAVRHYGYSVYFLAQEHEIPMMAQHFKYMKDHGETEITTPSGNKVMCHQMQAWKSIKLYNTEEMAVLIDGLIYMAQDEGIKVSDYEDYMRHRK